MSLAQIQAMHGTAAQWAAWNGVLAAGEIGVETDTGKVKVGNGASVWTALPYLGAAELAAHAALTVGVHGLGEAASARVDFGPDVAPWKATGNALPGANGGFATITVLADGRILVAGGTGGAVLTDACAIFDPRTGSWTATGILNHARRSHAAVLLADGRVLVAAGLTPGDAFNNTAEVYDPALGTWALTGNLSVTRNDFVMVLLPSGKALAVGGEDGSGGSHDTSETWDPSTGLWTPSANAMTESRMAPNVVRLADGRVLAAGGISTIMGVTRATADVYDPATDRWTRTSDMSVPGCLGGVVTLADGRVLVSGGATAALVVTNVCQVWNPSTGNWLQVGSMTVVRVVHGATLLPSGLVLLSGGLIAAAPASAVATCDLYNPSSDTCAATVAMAEARGSHVAALLPDGRVLVAGGASGFLSGPLATCELFAAAVAALTAQSGVASITRLAMGGYRLTLTSPARTLWAAGGKRVYVVPASRAQPRDRSAQIQQAQVIGTDVTAGTIDVLITTGPDGIGPAPLPFEFWIR